MGFVGNLPGFTAVKNFENPLRIDKVIAMSLMYYFFGDTVYVDNFAAQCIHLSVCYVRVF